MFFASCQEHNHSNKFLRVKTPYTNHILAYITTRKSMYEGQNVPSPSLTRYARVQVDKTCLLAAVQVRLESAPILGGRATVNTCASGVDFRQASFTKFNTPATFCVHHHNSIPDILVGGSRGQIKRQGWYLDNDWGTGEGMKGERATDLLTEFKGRTSKRKCGF